MGPLHADRGNDADGVAKVAGEIGRTASQVAIAWARQRSAAIVPILGARNLSQLKDNLGCLGFELSGEELRRLDEASRIELGFPLDFLEQAKELIYGRTFPLIDGRKAA